MQRKLLPGMTEIFYDKNGDLLARPVFIPRLEDSNQRLLILKVQDGAKNRTIYKNCNNFITDSYFIFKI